MLLALFPKTVRNAPRLRRQSRTETLYTEPLNSPESYAEPTGLVRKRMDNLQHIKRYTFNRVSRIPLIGAALVVVIVVIAAPFFVADALASKEPISDVLGIRPNMSEEEARSRLQKIGSRKKDDSSKHDIWDVRDSRISILMLKYSKDHQVRYVTAMARTDSPKRLRYSDVGELKQAQKATDGRNYTYTWRVETKGKQHGYLVIARGSHPEYLTSYTIVRLLE